MWQYEIDVFEQSILGFILYQMVEYMRENDSKPILSKEI